MSTPTIRQAARRSVFWIIALLFVLLLAFIGFITSGGASSAGLPLDARNPAPAGSKAVVEVLRQHGIRVIVADTLPEAQDQAKAVGAHDGTVLFSDVNGYLSGEQLAEVRDLAAHLVVIEPDFDTLGALAPGLALAGPPANEEPLEAQCEVPAAVRAGTISSGGQAYRVTGDGSADTNTHFTTCFPAGDGSYSMLQGTTDNAVDSTGDSTGDSAVNNTGTRLLTVLGNPEVLGNETVIGAGNAALALNLLGASDTLIWYLPTLEDVAATGPPSLGELSPDWLPSVTGLLALVALAAAVWRGRRFGPLVVEKLPVIVRSTETMEGRARLYQRASARTHALDSVRIGTISRLATRLALSRTANVDEVASAVAARTGRDLRAVRSLLVDAEPAGDAQLMQLSDALLSLEAELGARLDTRNDSSQTTDRGE